MLYPSPRLCQWGLLTLARAVASPGAPVLNCILRVFFFPPFLLTTLLHSSAITSLSVFFFFFDLAPFREA